MPITPAFAKALRSFEATITQQQRDSALRLEPTRAEKLDAAWSSLLPAMREFLAGAVVAGAPIEHSSISRDGAEISVKIRDTTAARGTRYLILSRKHPLDAQAPADQIWLCEVGGTASGFGDVIEGARGLIKRVVAAST
ncbi:MAG TPA: hypothetical protein VFB36_01165 [Nevskiaceae bacterium]|nr:hypothetical protein [Nevskiaceae bacterium]